MRLRLYCSKRMQMVVAVSGIKNSGKTTLITKLIPEFRERGYKVATIKHDGHEFEADVKGTDTYQHSNAGAYGTAIFSNGQFMVKKQVAVTEQELICMFPEADIIILEGFKNSTYPKIEVIRKGNSTDSVCNREGLFAIVTDTECLIPGIKKIQMNDTKKAADSILEYFMNREKEK